MRIPTGITLGNLINTVVIVVVTAASFYASWTITGYRIDETAQRVASLEIQASKLATVVADIRLTYATAASMHDLSADQRSALVPLQSKIDQLSDRIAAVDRNQVETSATLKALIESVADLKRAVMGRQPTAMHEAQASPRPP